MSRQEVEVASPQTCELERASRALFGITAQVMRAAAGETVSATALHALLVLAEAEPCAVTEVAGRTGLSDSGASRVVDRLVSSRLVRRSTCADDRRRLRLELTSAGRRLTGRIIRRRTAAIDAVTGQMDDADRSELVRGMTAFAAAAAAAGGHYRGQLKELA
jgi:MarR family transcriptional regulator, organic hydroperoxide resistance regulator